VGDPVLHVLHHAAPIPVGNRVELHFYERDLGFFSVGFREQTDMPLVRDLETGIEYVPAWLFKHDPTELLGGSSSHALEPAPSVRPTRSITGRVVACRVISGTVGSEWTVFTYLTVREEDGRIYR
jgi:hypothetical protein